MVHIPKPPANNWYDQDDDSEASPCRELVVVPPPQPPGRPTNYSFELAERVCELIMAGGPEGRISAITARDDMPAKSTIFLWLSKHREFMDLYARAKQIQAFNMAEELMEISDDASNDYVERFDKEGNSLGFMPDKDHIQRSRLRVDSRKWLMTKYLPKVFGDKVEQTVVGDPERPIRKQYLVKFID